MVTRRQALPGIDANLSLAAVKRVDDLGRRLVCAGDEHELTAGFQQPARALLEIRVFDFLATLAEQFGESPRFHAVRDDDRRLRQDQVLDRGDHLVVGQFVAAAVRQHRVEHQRDIRIVGNDFGDRRNVFDAAEQADLERVHGHVFQHAPRLVGDEVGVDGKDTLDTERVLDGNGGDDGQRMTAHRSQRQHIRLHPAAARRIGCGKSHDQWGEIGVIGLGGH